MTRRLSLPWLSAVLLSLFACGGDSLGPPSDSVWIQATNIVLPPGDSVRLPTLAYLGGQPYLSREGEVDPPPPAPLTWSSSDPGVARVAGEGWVYALAAGHATITVSVQGVRATSALTVRPGPEAPWSVSAVSAGGSHGCALTPAGLAFCWGDSHFGEVGDGVVRLYTSLAAPRAVAGGRRFRSITAGFAHVCALAEDGAIYCWGDDSYGQLGDGHSTPERKVATPTRVLASSSFAAVSAGNWWTCALDGRGAAFCWGMGWGSRPFAVGGPVFVALTTGGEHACGLTAEAHAFCWGGNGYGQLGTGNFQGSRTPVPVSGVLRFQQLDGGSLHTCGVTVEGVGYCWGNNWDGRLGIGQEGHTSVPTAVVGGLRFRSIDAGGVHTCGLAEDGQGYCWGSNWRGQLGNGIPYPGYTGPGLSIAAVPKVVGGLQWTTLVAASGDRSCGIATSGQLYCWGDNDFGALGTGRFAALPGTAIAVSARPVPVISPP